MKKILALTILAGLLFIRQLSVYADNPEFITLCHAAGLEGTTQYVTLTIPYAAAFGQAGHFNENGTTQAGHEEDLLGECNTVTPTLLPDYYPTTTPTESPKPTDTVPTPSPVIPSPSTSPTGVQPTNTPSYDTPSYGTPSYGTPNYGTPANPDQVSAMGPGEPKLGILK